jgi:hypothetical protein
MMGRDAVAAARSMSAVAGLIAAAGGAPGFLDSAATGPDSSLRPSSALNTLAQRPQRT